MLPHFGYYVEKKRIDCYRPVLKFAAARPELSALKLPGYEMGNAPARRPDAMLKRRQRV